jgi:hypothetical protein
VQPAILMDEEDVRRERDERIINYFERAFHILNAYQERQRPEKHKMSLLAMQFALGFHLAAGKDNIAALARACGVSRAAMTKCVNGFIKQLALQPLHCQRDEEARRNMSEARKQQLVSPSP